jgi:protein-disulfide isomerase
LRALRKDVEALRASQMEMQKNLQIVKDILMGKQPPLENVFVNTAGAPSMGANDAKVTMVEFSDFQCPFCGRYANQTMAKVIDEYVKTGKVRYIFRNFPLEQIHPLALKAAEAADCANEQGKFWEAHDRFFQNQKTLDGKEWEAHALGLGLDAPKFQQCIDSGKFTQQVKADEAEGTMLAIKGTPTFFFGRTDGKNGGKLKAVKLLSGAVPFEKFKEIIDVLLNPKDEKEADDSR